MASAPVGTNGDGHGHTTRSTQGPTQRSLQEFLRFRHLLRNLYADELGIKPIQRLLNQLQDTWPLLAADIDRLKSWLITVAAA